jgi:hypothetical protein
VTASTTPAARRAHQAVADAIKKRELTRQPCEICGDDYTVAHHDDYGRPLDVQWLCLKHHKRVHRLMACRKLSQEADWAEDFLDSYEAANLVGLLVSDLYKFNNQPETVSDGNHRIYRGSSVERLVNHFARVNAMLANE